MAKLKAILVAADGSDHSDRAVAYALDLFAAGLCAELHFVNVQPNLGGAISSFISKDQIDSHHRDEGNKALASADVKARLEREGGEAVLAPPEALGRHISAEIERWRPVVKAANIRLE